MARYQTVIAVPRSLDETFAVVSDFSNAQEWDPRTVAARRADDGEIGVGTRFLLTGGMLPEATIRRFRIPLKLATMTLPYDVVSYDPPNGFVLEGSTPLVRYRDEITFTATDGGTDVGYLADLSLRGVMRIFEPLMRRMFQRIGDEATADLAATVVRLSDG